MISKWVIMSPGDTRDIWECRNEDCECEGNTLEIFPEFYDESGTPICDQCDSDMWYLRTEVFLPEEIADKLSCNKK